MSLDKRLAYALSGLAAVGAGAGLAYYLYKTQCQAATGIVEAEFVVEETHLTWLDGIAAKHTNGDVERALHALIDHCKTTSEKDDGAETIFKKVRCNSCEKKKKVTFKAKLTPEHIAFINEAKDKYEIAAGPDKTLRVMLEYAINDTEEGVMFGA